ncbi:hypothetical protein ACMHYB_01165 [Sorangium sp. So ce1128]
MRSIEVLGDGVTGWVRSPARVVACQGAPEASGKVLRQAASLCRGGKREGVRGDQPLAAMTPDDAMAELREDGPRKAIPTCQEFSANDRQLT